MLSIPPSTRVFLARGVTDVRKSFGSSPQYLVHLKLHAVSPLR
jgi:hypothetical protein